MANRNLDEIEELIRQNEESLKALKAFAARLRGETKDSNQHARQILLDSTKDQSPPQPLQP